MTSHQADRQQAAPSITTLAALLTAGLAAGDPAQQLLFVEVVPTANPLAVSTAFMAQVQTQLIQAIAVGRNDIMLLAHSDMELQHGKSVLLVRLSPFVLFRCGPEIAPLDKSTINSTRSINSI
jgi:hypothetical protein